MIIKQIKNIGIKLLNWRISKIQSKLNKPIKGFDEGISRAKDLISIGNLKEAEALLLNLSEIEKKAFERISSDASLSDSKLDKLKREYNKKESRINNLLNLIKSKKLGVAFVNVDNFSYIDGIKIINKNIKDGNFSEARLLLMKLKQKEKNLFDALIKKNSTSFLKKKIYLYAYRKKIENFYELEISIFYNELVGKIAKFTNLKSLIKIFRIVIDNKDWDFFDKISSEIKSFEEKLLFDIKENSIASFFYKIKAKKRYKLVLKILNKAYRAAYKAKTGLSIDLSQVKSIEDTFIVINDFVKSYNFEKAMDALSELREKETSYFEGILGDNSIDKNAKDKLLKKFRKFENKLKLLEYKINKRKKEYEIKTHLSDLKIKNNQLRKQLQLLLNSKDFDGALDLLNNYKKSLGDDLDKYIIFLEKWKFKILKSKEKYLNSKSKKASLFEQAKNLVGEDVELEDSSFNLDLKTNSIFSYFKNIYKKYVFLKKQREDKFLLANIESLLGNAANIKESIIKQKLEKVHSGLVKDTSSIEIDGYSVFGKTLAADSISGDTFGFYKYNDGERFFIGDATGHGIKSGFIVSLLTNSFYNLVSKFNTLKELVVDVNNKLKQDLSSGNFITSIFFEISYKNKDKIRFIGMGHDPMFVYSKTSSSVEKIFPGGIAAGMTILREQAFLKEKEINMSDGDVLLLYTDGVIEARNKVGEMYSINRLQEKFLQACRVSVEPKEIYEFLYKDLSGFVEGNKFFDDVTIIVIKRDKKKDLVSDEKLIENILQTQNISKKYVKNLKGKSKDDIENFLKSKRKEKELDAILKNLKNIYKTGDVLSLKKECQRYIKEGFLHKDIVKYLSFAIDNEAIAKINQQNIRLQNKYETLKKLLKSGEYKTVLEECSNIILNEGKI